MAIESERPSIAHSLTDLISRNLKFRTLYVDPPWRYENTASRGAANNHYSTMSIDELTKLPIEMLVTPDAHLHLWTTNAFLRDAFDLIDVWGFTYKSCLVWVKPQLGMGNYWRVSHEYLLLGIRGQLPFQDKSQRSWVEARRKRHSQKPYCVRELIERVSPGPYLELFGREEIPDSQWTVFGDQVERRLF